MRGRARVAWWWGVLCALGCSAEAAAQETARTLAGCAEGAVARAAEVEDAGTTGARAALAPELVAEAWWASGASLDHTRYPQRWRVERAGVPERGVVVSLAWRWGEAARGQLALSSACLRPGWDARRALLGDAARDEELDGSGWTVGGAP